jgi:hypothetical protein
VQAVLSAVPEVLDPQKDGTEEADPYVLAMAVALQTAGNDVRVITEDVKATGAKMSLAGGRGLSCDSGSLAAYLSEVRENRGVDVVVCRGSPSSTVARPLLRRRGFTFCFTSRA